MGGRVTALASPHVLTPVPRKRTTPAAAGRMDPFGAWTRAPSTASLLTSSRAAPLVPFLVRTRRFCFVVALWVHVPASGGLQD